MIIHDGRHHHRDHSDVAPPRQPPRGGRSFGTLLSANTPSRSTKKAIVRKSRTRDRETHPDEGSGGLQEEHQQEDHAEAIDSYVVTFEAGKIGLRLEPGFSSTGREYCLVQELIPDGVAAADSRIQVGDYVHKVNDKLVTSYDVALELLKVEASRRVEFVRSSPGSDVLTLAAALGQSTLMPRSTSLLRPAQRKGKSVPGVIRRSPTPQESTSPRSFESASSLSTVETSNQSRSGLITTQPSSLQRRSRGTPPPLRSRSLDPPTASVRRRVSYSSPLRRKPRQNADQSFSSPSEDPLGDRWHTLGKGDTELHTLPTETSASNQPVLHSGPSGSPSQQYLPRPQTRTKRRNPASPPAKIAEPGSEKSGTVPSPPLTPTESLQLRVAALEAELQQERDNTKILQHDRIAAHQLKRELDEAREASRNVHLEKQQLQTEMRQLQQRQATAPRREDTAHRQEAANVSSQLAHLEGALAAAQMSIASTERELESVRSDRDGLKSIVTDLERQLEQQESVSRAVVETMNNKLDAAQEECSKREHDLETVKAEKDLLESLIPRMDREMDQARESFSKSHEESSKTLLSVQDRLSSTQDEVSCLTLKNEELESQVAELTEALHAAKKEAKDVQNQLENSQYDSNVQGSDRPEIDRLQFQLADVQRSHEVMNERLKQQEALHDLEIEKLQMDNESLVAQLEDLKASSERRSAEESAVSYFQLQDKEAMIDVQRGHLTDLERKAEKLESQLAAKTRELKSVNKAVDELRNSNESYKAEVNRLTSMVDDMTRMEFEVGEKLSAAKGELELAKEDYRLRVKCLESENNQLQERLDRMRQDLRTEKSRSLALEKSKHRVNNELAEHETRSFAMLKIRNDEVDELNSKLLLSKRQLEDLTIELGEAAWLYEKAQKTCSDTEDKLARATEESRKLRREVQSLDSSSRHQQGLIDSLSAEKMKLSSEVSDLQLALAESDEELSSTSVLYRTTLESLEDLRAELTYKANELVGSQSNCARLEEQCSQLNCRIEEANDEKARAEDAYTASVLSLNDELAEASAKRSQLESLLASVRRSASESESRCSQLQDLIDRERKNYNDLRLEADSLRQDFERQLEVATTHLKELEATIFKRDRDISSLQAYSTKSSKELHITKKELAAAHERFESSRAQLLHENEELLSSLSLLRTRNEELSSQLNLANARQAEQQQDSASTIQSLEEKVRLTVAEAQSKTRAQEELLKEREIDSQSLRAHRDEVTSAKSEIVRLTALLRRTKEESENLSRANDEMRQHQVDKTNQLIANYRRDFDRLEKEKHEVEHLLRKSEERREAAEDRLYSSEEGLLTARSERERLILEKNSLLSDLENAKEKLETLQRDLQALQDASRGSNDGTGHEFGGLSKSELCSKCDELQTEVRALRSQAEGFVRQDSMRSGQLAQVEEDNALLQQEIDKLIQSNSALESRLQEAMVFRAEAMKTETQYLLKLSDKDEQVRTLERNLEETEKKNVASMDKVTLLEAERMTVARSVDSELAGVNKTVSDLERKLRSAASDKRAAEDELDQKREEVFSLRLETKALREKVSTFESQLSHTKDQLQSAKQLYDVLQVEKGGEVDRHSIQTKILENECTALRQKVSQLEDDLDAARSEVHQRLENESFLRESLEKQRIELVETEESRENDAEKLAEATNLISSQKDSIALLEQRALDAEHTAASLASQVSQLNDTLKRHEESNESKAGLRDSIIKDLEDRQSHLEKERDEANAASNTLREELRQLRRNHGEADKLIASMRERVEAFKALRDKAKGEVEDVRSALEESKSNSRRLQDEAETKRMENDRVKANVKLLNATVSRINSDLLLYKEAALQAEFRLARSDSANEEKLRLEAELVRKTSKLEHLSEVFRSQQKVLSLSQNLEEQLITFIEGVIHQVDEAFEITSSVAPGAHAVFTQLERSLELRGLDLAGLERSKKEISGSRLSLWHVVQKVLTALEDKRKQLCDWKKQRSQRILTIMTTPEPKGRPSIPDTPVVMETLHNVKRVLSEHLSPLKQSVVGRLDVEYFQKVIHSLEHHIDILLDDLQSAREALSTKQQLFLDLEQVASHHEWEKSRLEKQLQKQRAEVQALQDTLQRQAALKRTSEQELDGVRAQLRALQDAHQQGSASSFDGNETDLHGDIMQPTMDSELQQRQVALQLTHHLDESRLKLAKLKQQRRRRSTEPSLDRIAEGYETT